MQSQKQAEEHAREMKNAKKIERGKFGIEATRRYKVRQQAACAGGSRLHAAERRS